MKMAARFFIGVVGWSMFLPGAVALTLEELETKRSLWPKDVTVNVPIETAVMIDGRNSVSCGRG